MLAFLCVRRRLEFNQAAISPLLATRVLVFECIEKKDFQCERRAARDNFFTSLAGRAHKLMLPDQPIIEEHVKGVDLIATRIAVAKGQRCENREKGSPHARLGLVSSR